MMPKFIQVWKQDFRLCWSFVSKQTLQRNLSKSRRTSALSMARPWKFVRITVAFWERKVILNEQWPFSGGVSFPSVFIAEIMPYGVISVFILGRYFPTVPCSCLFTAVRYEAIVLGCNSWLSIYLSATIVNRDLSSVFAYSRCLYSLPKASKVNFCPSFGDC